MQRISAIFDLIIWSHRDLEDDFLRPPLGALCVDALNHTLCSNGHRQPCRFISLGQRRRSFASKNIRHSIEDRQDGRVTWRPEMSRLKKMQDHTSTKPGYPGCAAAATAQLPCTQFVGTADAPCRLWHRRMFRRVSIRKSSILWSTSDRTPRTKRNLEYQSANPIFKCTSSKAPNSLSNYPSDQPRSRKCSKPPRWISTAPNHPNWLATQSS